MSDAAKQAAETARLAEELIKAAGSKRSAYKAIKAAKTTGARGRPEGSPYLEVDAKLMFEIEGLQTTHRLLNLKRGGRGLNQLVEPKRRRLIAEVVGKETKQGKPRLGKSNNAVVTRLAKRSSSAEILVEAIRQHRPDLLQFLPDDVDAQLRSIDPDDPTKPNFAMIMEGLLFLEALRQKYPEEIARAERNASNEPRAADPSLEPDETDVASRPKK